MDRGRAERPFNTLTLLAKSLLIAGDYPPVKAFDVNQLLHQAQTETGLSDFGPPDFLEGLDALISGLNTQGDISDERWQDAFNYFKRLLVNRLHCAKDLREHPEILERELRPPVIILPLPRTGSTKLHRLLSASNSFNAVPFWQMHLFSRIPGEPNGGADRRIAETRRFEEWIYQVCPDTLKGHPMFTEEPEEEQILKDASFRSPRLAALFSAPQYSQWLSQADISPTYDYLLTQFKYLYWQFYTETDKPFLLKSPSNIGYENQLVRIFGPQTKMIMPHRDPVNVVSSICRVIEYSRAWFISENQQGLAEDLGQMILAMFAHQSQVHIAWREQNPEVQILDVAYRDINNNTEAVLNDVYDFLDIELTSNIRQAVNAWERDKSKNRYARNDYRPEEFGLTTAQIHQAFAPYMERFQQYL
jgi:LPS sulfotransferase NodH